VKVLPKLIQENGMIVYDFGQALLHFGYVPSVRGLTLAQLVGQWRDGQDQATLTATSLDWAVELCAELLRALRDVPAQPSWALFRSQMFPDWWLYPVVSSARIEADGSIEFDVNMYRVPGVLPARAAA